MKHILILFLLLNSSLLRASDKDSAKDYLLVPQVQELVVSYAMENRSSSDAYVKIKELTFDAMTFIKTEESTPSLNEAIKAITAKWKGESNLLSRKQVVINILAAVNH